MLVHVGYHKTGTTFLQTGLFSSSTTGFVSPWAQSDIRRELVLCSDFDWDANAAQAWFGDGIGAAETAGLVPVLSDERLCGSPHAGGFDSARIAHRLAEVFPGARVLIGIREQASAIYSTYQQYVRNGGGAPIEKYLRPRHQAEVPQFRFEHWAYHRLISLYRELFGLDHVLVLPYEQLRDSPDSWTSRICRFVGASAPASTVDRGERYRALSATGIAVKRHANRVLFRGALNPAAPLYVKDLEQRFERLDGLWPASLSAAIERRITSAIERDVAGRYGASNRETARLTGLDLAALGYETIGP